MEFFATCPTGFEPLLANELRRLGVGQVRPLQGRVSFEGGVREAYTVCLWSRLASRVIAVLARVAAGNSDELYASLHGIAWEEELLPRTSFVIDATGTNAELRNTQFVALRARDAVVDRMREVAGMRPSVDPRNPDLRIVVRVSRNRAMVGIDLAGAPLFRRGYERPGGGLRPDYAAALLELGAWPTAVEGGAGQSETDGSAPDRLTTDGGASLVVLNDGQGTLLAEAGLIAAHRAPGLLRARWGFEGWARHDAATWEACHREAERTSIEEPNVSLYVLEGGATTPRATLRAAGVDAEARVVSADELPSLGKPALLACDMCAYDADDLAAEAAFVSGFVDAVAATMPVHTAVFSRDGLPGIALRTEPATTIRTNLGRDDARFIAFGELEGLQNPARIGIPNGPTITPLVAGSDQFAARLRKVARLRRRWAKREDITCYRVYDADLPDYALTIDLFEGTDPKTLMPTGKRWLYVSEFAPPKEVDPAMARCRLLDALTISSAVLGVAPENVYTRVRRRAKGGSQYAEEGVRGQAGRARDGRDGGDGGGYASRDGGRNGGRDDGGYGGRDGGNRGARDGRDGRRERKNLKGAATWGSMPAGAHIIDEGGLLFEVNFSSRLDCGIFLDHRDTRAMLREMAKETQGSKRFLNLFAYTGTATCYAADGGMIHTTTVDLSRPSLDWARRNMARNGFEGSEHEFVQADVLSWIGEQRHSRNRWDLVFCDVPTFSNSRRMRGRSFDVQRDHVELLINLSRLLTRNGKCVFSCNLRTFKPDLDALARAKVEVEDITKQTIPEDFARNQRVHHTFIVRKAKQ